MLSSSGDYKRLMVENDPSQWRTYDTNEVLKALKYIE